MDTLFALLTRVSHLFAQGYDKVITSTVTEISVAALIATVLGIIGLMAARQIKLSRV